MTTFAPNFLQGQVAFVTGGGSGIGRGIVKALLQHGAHVAIMSRNMDKLSLAAAELEAETGGQCLAVRGDVREPDEIADCALFLASDAARWVTGAIFVVDGGAWLTGMPLSDR